jgi:hypothetical protein
LRSPLKAGLIYFAIVFGCGFLFGTIRTLWIAPHLGDRMAELIESPFMVGISLLAAQKIVRRMNIAFTISKRLTMGFVGLALMLFAEFTLVLCLRGLSLKKYFATRDPVSGTAYYFALLLFALGPLVVSRDCTRIQKS